MIAAAKFGRVIPTAEPAGGDPPSPERLLSYYLLVQRYRNGKAVGQPFPLDREILFPPDYRIRLIFSSPQTGYLYLMNEGPVSSGGLPSYNMLFPSPARNDGTALLRANQETTIPSDKEFFVFDAEEGEEKLWIVWSKEAIPELELAKSWVNERDRGNIKDSAQTSAIQKVLGQNAVRPPLIEKDEGQGRTHVHAPGDTLIHLVRLAHH